MISFIASIYNYFFVNNQQNNESNIMLIQSVYKMHQEKKEFNKMKKATIKIQRFWRNYQKNKNKKENSISDISQNVKQECINNEENFCYKKRFNKNKNNNKNNKNNKKNKKQNRKFNNKNLHKF